MSDRMPAIKVLMLPRDTNPMGTIFGGVILSHLDLAGGVEARKDSNRRVVTKAMREVDCVAPVFVGDTVSFTIVGDLKIREITAEARFQATVTVVAEDRLEGTAEATILRSTYNLVIPQVPFVADVGEEVLLGIKFVATAVDQ